MLSQLSRSQAPRPTAVADLCWGLAVISRDPTLADRAERALERDGVMVSLVADGSDLALLREAERSPAVVVIGAEFGEHRLEQALQWIERNLPHALVLVIVQPGQHVDAGSLLAMGAKGLVHERDIDHPQFAWTFQRYLYDCMHDYLVEMFLVTPQSREQHP